MSKKNKSFKSSEGAEQCMIFTWASWNFSKFPELRLLFHVPNGGLRNVVVAKKLKKEGVKKGVPDLFLAVARKGFHGYFIEMKYGNRKLTEEQLSFFESARKEGYLCDAFWSADDAIEALKTYLS